MSKFYELTEAKEAEDRALLDNNKHSETLKQEILSDEELDNTLLTDSNSSTNNLEQVFEDINKYTKYYIPTSYSGNNKLYNEYVRKFLTRRAQQIFNSPKVLIYAQVPQKLQGVMFAFSPSKYRKAIKSLFNRVTTFDIDSQS